uniref:Uncharacterized protein n=1 Tax=Eptatretus burgeri TaxID=7764 RepID=A0A8C4NH45_EPTBU
MKCKGYYLYLVLVRRHDLMTASVITLLEMTVDGNEMASSSPIEDRTNDLTCAICLLLFEEPITLPCGHSFCSSCLNNYWKIREESTACLCPNCREVFPQKPKLKKSVILASLVERMKLSESEGSGSRKAGGQAVVEDGEHDDKSWRRFVISDCSFYCSPMLSLNSILNHNGQTPILDPSSAHPWIKISQDLSTATLTWTQHLYPEHPDMFDFYHQVLSSECFSSGRHYWEVHVSSSRGWVMGISLNSIRRKGRGNDCRLGRNPESWCLRKDNFKYSAWHNNRKTRLSVPGDPERFGFLLDCEAGELRCFGDSLEYLLCATCTPKAWGTLV